MVDPGLEDERPDAVHNDDGVVVLRSDSENEIVSTVPGRQVLPVSYISSPLMTLSNGNHPPIPLIPIDRNILLPTIRVHKHNRRIPPRRHRLHPLRHIPRQRQIEIIQQPRHARPILARAPLDGLQRCDQVGEVRRAGAPAHGEDAVGAALVGELVRTCAAGAGVAAGEEERAGLVEGQGVALILEEDDGGGAHVANEAGVLFVCQSSQRGVYALGSLTLTLRVDVLVEGLVLREESVEVRGREGWVVLLQQVPAGQNTSSWRKQVSIDSQPLAVHLTHVVDP